MAKQDDNAQPLKVAIVGTGNVGATYAYALVLSGLVAEIVLINRDQEVATGEAMDLTHATSLASSTRVSAGTYADCKDAVVTVLTAGVPQGDKASRLKLVAQNGEVFQSIVPPVIEHNPEGLLLIATNPVDVLTYAAWKISGLDASKVIGSGTVLDSARLRSLLAARLSLDPHSV
ncbi:MAG: L-lactate dehydrogenase, partial [Chloroflexota bacterium]|nr:L-lactate dehydrogenase [Chloroflexota bacterium]